VPVASRGRSDAQCHPDVVSLLREALREIGRSLSGWNVAWLSRDTWDAGVDAVFGAGFDDRTFFGGEGVQREDAILHFAFGFQSLFFEFK
jgi:hypothetical protein